jgi:hypothetical protein
MRDYVYNVSASIKQPCCNAMKPLRHSEPKACTCICLRHLSCADWCGVTAMPFVSSPPTRQLHMTRSKG